jgi:SnoaL-like domain
MGTQGWWQELIATIDARQTQAFASFLCEDAVFRYGSNADVHGRAAIATVVDQVFATFRASSHELQRWFEVEDCRIGQGIVTYTRRDHTKVALPFCNVLTMRGDLVSRYEIFIDPTPLYA